MNNFTGFTVVDLPRLESGGTLWRISASKIDLF